MPTGKLHYGWKRLIAVTMALVLALVPLTGMSAHACVHGLYTGSHAAHPDPSIAQPNVDAIDDGAAGLHVGQADPGQADRGAHSTHADCRDLACHCGSTITEPLNLTTALVYARMQYIRLIHVMTGSPGSSLDRPPKHFAHA